MRSLPGVVDERLQEPVLGRREVDLLVAALHEPASEIDLEPVEVQRPAAPRTLVAGTPQCRSQSGQELLHRERLRQVVVGSGVERADLVGLLLTHREHDDRNRRERAHTPDDLFPVEIREPEVEEDQVGTLVGRRDDALLAGAHGHDLVAVCLQARAHRAADLRLVVDHEDLASLLLLPSDAAAAPASRRELDTTRPRRASLHADPSSVRDDDRVRDRETEAAAAASLRGRFRPR